MTSILITEFVTPDSCSHTWPLYELYSLVSANPPPPCISYYIVRRGNVSVPDMYNFHGIYRYSPKFASNWRAVVAFFIGCIPPLPGFVENIVQAGGSTAGVSLGGQHLYDLLHPPIPNPVQASVELC